MDGTLDRVSLATLLREAHTFRRIYDPSPLVVVGVFRLLVAILQDILRPTHTRDLLALWRAECFPPEAIERFGAEFAHRFDLFSKSAPFLQSADLPLAPARRGDAKPVGYLFPELPAGTAVTHYTHAYDGANPLCARCAAAGLLVIPPFATSGGAGIKPSINGVPPIYVLPNLEPLYRQLVAALVTPDFQPAIADRSNDTPWWRREPPIVGKKAEVLRVGYGHSLTFPARRVRLHPEPMTTPCLRCGETTPWGVRTMVFEMGESRPKDAAFWDDPFAAYRVAKKAGDPPTPIRPVEGRAVWREFGNLFLPSDSKDKGGGHRRPRLLDQLDELWQQWREMPDIPLRTVGLRTDMKAKVFEWEEGDFTLPPALLDDADAAQVIEAAIEFATEADCILKRVFRKHFGDGRFESVIARLSQGFWVGLEPGFRTLVARLGRGADADTAAREWARLVVRHGLARFRAALEQLATDAATLRERVLSEQHCAAALNKHLQTRYPQEEPPHETG